MTHSDDENERLTDVLDKASAAELHNTSGLIKDIQGRCRPQQLPLDDGSYAVTECEECGEEIGEQRLRVAIKNLWCVVCATTHEKRNYRGFSR